MARNRSIKARIALVLEVLALTTLFFALATLPAHAALQPRDAVAALYGNPGDNDIHANKVRLASLFNIDRWVGVRKVYAVNTGTGPNQVDSRFKFQCYHKDALWTFYTNFRSRRVDGSIQDWRTTG